ncbi:MAG: MSHA biogenesis protein MshG [Cellvibrionaceae bacterium]|jgi:MSHA biogenesis protein MshG
MAHFNYFGRDIKGEVVEGSVERSDAKSVAQYLIAKKVTPIRIKQVGAPTANFVGAHYSIIGRLSGHFFQPKPVTDEELIMFTRQMHAVCKSGIALTQGIKNIAYSMNAGTLKQALDNIVNRLHSGSNLSLALQAHSSIFDKLFISMVQVGESSGNLDMIFLQLSQYIENDLEVRQSVKTATRYPSFVLLAILAALMAITLFVIPTFSNIFSRFDVELPLATRVLLIISETIINYWWALLIIAASFFIFINSWFNSRYLKQLWDKQKLTLPLVGVLINQATLARYARSLAIMLHSGVSLNKAISLCADIVDNEFLAKKIKLIKDSVERGESLSKSHRNAHIFTPLILQMIKVGEDTGAIDTLLIDVSEYYERQVRYHLKSLSAKLEPLLIIVMALLVLVLSLGIFLPIWELYNIQR